MKKTAKKTPGTEEAAGQTLMLPLAELVRTELRAFVVSCGMHALVSMLELDREELCGPAYARGRESGPRRSGSTTGRLVMGGRKVTVPRPRARDESGEVPLPAWVEFCAEDPLHQRALEQMVLGVTTRKYERSLEPIDDALAPSSTSKSAVSRRFKAMTQDQLATLMNAPLDGLNLLAVMIDGIHIKDHLVLIALGIDDGGGKHVLGLWEGATENHRVCSDLLANLIERGLPVDRSLLFVVDGSKALTKAIRKTFGELALIQRCQVHKIRNVLDYLPKEKQVGAHIA